MQTAERVIRLLPQMCLWPRYLTKFYSLQSRLCKKAKKTRWKSEVWETHDQTANPKDSTCRRELKRSTAKPTAQRINCFPKRVSDGNQLICICFYNIMLAFQVYVLIQGCKIPLLDSKTSEVAIQCLSWDSRGRGLSRVRQNWRSVNIHAIPYKLDLQRTEKPAQKLLTNDWFLHNIQLEWITIFKVG